MKRRINLSYYLITFILVCFIAIPLIPLVIFSFSYGWKWPDLFPDQISLDAWAYVFDFGSKTWNSIMTSLKIAVTVTLINLFLALPAANILGRMDFKGKWLLEGLFYAPIIVPAFVSVMGIHMTFIQMGITDTLLGVILAHIIPTLPYMIRALVISYNTIGYIWEEQGKVLGASSFQCFFYIILPFILPGIIAGCSLSILVSLNQYIITFLIGGGQVMTLPLVMFPFISGGDPVIGSVLSLVFMIMAGGALLVMDVLLKKYYVRNVTLHFS
ncbi:ABC transporter permease [Aquibacillus kalidii]|uniref:ABC transporter permease n=1 Tax=Aquibacillus kalidii TaxID=2762597 RepID=UPI0016492ABD|nr:ABC transporter permease subunit [Aquibacillus kalidii]